MSQIQCRYSSASALSVILTRYINSSKKIKAHCAVHVRLKSIFFIFLGQIDNLQRLKAKFSSSLEVKKNSFLTYGILQLIAVNTCSGHKHCDSWDQ